MGYLSQKKKDLRETLALKIASLLFIVTTCFSLLSDTEWLFQAYFLQVLLFLYTLFTRRFSYSFVFFILLTINYFQISSVSNLFFGNKEDAYRHQIEATYFYDQPINIDDSLVSTRKLIKLNGVKDFYMTKIKLDQKEITFLSVDLANISAKERKQYLEVLSDFIQKESSSVVLIGNLGIPAWYRDIRRFIENNGLEVKNPLIFAQNGFQHNYFKAPTFYVLSFKNINLSDIKVLSPKDSKSYPPIKLNFSIRNS